MTAYWNDMLIDEEHPRPAWASFWRWFSQASAVELNRLSLRVRRELDDQAITYTVHGDHEEEQPWDLDALPYILDGDEWAGIAAALDQRARCLDRLLADCHGEQQCIASGLIPPQYVFEHPAFLQSCRGWAPAGGIYLHCYAADLVRGADGSWRVLNDRCQSPLGLGYALQNRFVIAGALPELYQDLDVQRMRPFFAQLDRCLHDHAGVDDPRIAILAGNTYGDNAYEQAFLARYLGYELVNGHDLTVRDDRCYMKTHGGLRQVHVLLRFVNDDWCDPLVFRADSLLGVPGLQRAAASGQLLVANALGSGLLDSPVIRPRIAAACRQVLGEEPLIDGLPCRWAVDADILAGTGVIKRTWNALRSTLQFSDRLTAQEHASLRGRIAYKPAAWCADDPLVASLTPVWQEGVQLFRPLALRCYLVRDGDGYHAMPGGLVRIAGDADLLHLGARHGGGSKDCWVLGGAGAHADPLPVMPPARVERQQRDLPSSRCDDLFWFGRQLERVEAMSRLLRCAAELAEEWAQGDRSELPWALEQALGDWGLSLGPVHRHWVDRRCRELVRCAGGPVAMAIGELLQMAARTRHLMSHDAWLQVQQLRDVLQREDLNNPADRLLLLCAAVSGTISENTVRDDAWRFLELGRRLQRAENIARLLSLVVGAGASREDLELVLQVADSRLTYRARYRSSIEVAAVVDLVGHDSGNPRALHFQIDVLGRLLGELPQPDQDTVATCFNALHQRMRDARAQDPLVDNLAEDMRQVVDLLGKLADVIDHAWFSHALAPSSVDRSQAVAENEASP